MKGLGFGSVADERDRLLKNPVLVANGGSEDRYRKLVSGFRIEFDVVRTVIRRQHGRRFLFHCGNVFGIEKIPDVFSDYFILMKSEHRAQRSVDLANIRFLIDGPKPLRSGIENLFESGIGTSEGRFDLFQSGDVEFYSYEPVVFAFRVL